MSVIVHNNLRKMGKFSSSIEKDEDENLYYNVRVLNNTENNRIVAQFSESRTIPVIERPQDYELSVIRFKVPAENIPIFLWEEEVKYFITMSFDGVDVSKELIYVSDFSPEEEKELYGKAIWSYQTLVDIVNTALEDAFTDLKALKPLAPPTVAPKMVLNNSEELFSLYAPVEYDDSTNTIGLYVNFDMFAYVPAFQYSSNPSLYQLPQTDLKYSRFRVKDNGNNSITYLGSPAYEMKQEYKTLALLNNYQSIVFETDSIPIEAEYLPTQTNVVRRIITDFEPLDSVNDRSAFQYYPQGPLRYYDLKSHHPLRRIDIKVYWTDRQGNQYPLYLSRGELFTMKIQFRKKTTIIAERLLNVSKFDDNE
jgi:hypothetical protein